MEGFTKVTWQNTGMKEQVIFELLRPIGVVGSMTETAKDKIVDVFTYDRKWHFKVHFGKGFHYVTILTGLVNGKDVTFNDAKYGMTDAVLESRDIDVDGWDCESNWISLFTLFNDLYRNGYVYVWNDLLKECLHDLCEACDLGVDSKGESIHFTEWTDYETNEDGWFVCDDELYHQLHIDEDAYFVFNEDTIDEVCQEVNGTCDRVWQKVAMQYPDGSIDFAEGYVVIGDHCGYDCNPIGIA